MQKITLDHAAEQLEGTWQPLLLAELNQQAIKLARFHGEFDWHHHEQEDEAFLVVKGRISILFRDQKIDLNCGELLVIPRGVEHKPMAEEEALVLLFEPNHTLNTGNISSPLTHKQLKTYSSPDPS